MLDRRFPVMLTVFALTLGLVASTPSVFAQSEGAAADRAAKWRTALGEAHQMLKDERHQEARDLTAGLAEDMMAHLGAGDDASYTMAVVSAFRAIAEVGLGNEADGLWYWRVATALHPAFAERDLTVYGAPALWLTQQDFRAGHQDPPPGNALTTPSLGESPAVEPPGSIADLETDDVSVVVETLVGRDGRPSEPRIVAAPGIPAVIYAVLEGVKSWTFTPATYDGKPVPMAHEVTIELGG